MKVRSREIRTTKSSHLFVSPLPLRKLRGEVSKKV
jgi:hypothetical protein